MKKSLVLIPALAGLLLLSGSPAGLAAQTTSPACPVNRVCVTYHKDTFAIDPAEGVYQEIVVEERTLIIRDLDGERTSQQVKLAGFLANGDTYTLTIEHVEERAGLYATADLGDTFGLTELS